MIKDETNDTAAAGPALVYCRVSTSALAAGTSLASQRAACLAHARSLGYSVARVTEEVFSGAELFGRPLLSRDRADIRAGRFKALIAYSVDRLTRDPAHLAVLSDECGRSGCRLAFATRDPEAGGPADEARAAGVERRKTIERISRGRRAKLLAGRPVFNGWALYGYRPDRAAGIYQVYEPEAAVVRRVFSMCAAGRGMHSIASTFNREGLPSPKSDKRLGARWSSAAVSDMLNDRSYMGEEVCRAAAQGGQYLPPPESEWVRLPDGVRPAVVPPELWETCQRSIRARAARMNNRRGHPALLRGHIFCAECGRRMIRNHFRRGKYEYLKYRCGSRWRPFDTGCRGDGVPFEAAHEWAWENVKPLLSDPDFIGRALADAERSGPQALLAADLRAVRRIYERREPGPRTPPAREKRRLEGVIAYLEARLAEAGRPAEALRRLQDLCGGAHEDLDSLGFEERRLALRALCFRVYANGGDPAGWRCEAGVSAEYLATAL
jgi:site-specific DNA recombinase